MDTEAVAAIVGIVALLVIVWRRAVDRYRKRQTRRRLSSFQQVAEERMAEERARLTERIRSTKARSHRAHPVVHRWPNDGGLGGAA